MKTRSPAAVSALDTHAGFWLRFVSNHVSHAFAHKLAGSGATVAEWVLLREMLESGRTSPGCLAMSTGLSRGAVSKLIDRLVGKGLTTRTEADGDRRFQDVELTAAGRALVPKLAALADRNDEEFFSALPSKEREALVATLKKLVAAHRLKRVPTN